MSRQAQGEELATTTSLGETKNGSTGGDETAKGSGDGGTGGEQVQKGAKTITSTSAGS